MTKKPFNSLGLGGSLLVDRRRLFGTLGMAAAGATAASMIPFKSSLASVPAKVVFGKADVTRPETEIDLSLAFPAYAENVPHVYPRVTEDDVRDPMDFIAIA